MTIRRLLTSAATLALAVTGVALPSASAWEASTVQASAVVAGAGNLPLPAPQPPDVRRVQACPSPHRHAVVSVHEGRLTTRLPSLSPWSFSL